MSSELTDLQVAQILRAKAQRYLDMAADLEGGLASRPASTAVSPASLVVHANAPLISFEDLMKALDSKQGRVKYVAKRLNQPEDHIRGLIKAPNSRYTIAAKGWIKPKEGANK